MTAKTEKQQTKKPRIKTKNNKFEFTKFTAHQNDELLPIHSILNLHPAKRALAGFAGQTQNMPCKRDVLSTQNWPLWVLSFDLLVCANTGVKRPRPAVRLNDLLADPPFARPFVLTFLLPPSQESILTEAALTFWNQLINWTKIIGRSWAWNNQDKKRHKPMKSKDNRQQNQQRIRIYKENEPKTNLNSPLPQDHRISFATELNRS